MAAVSRAFAEVESRQGLILGVLPGVEVPVGYPNPWVEVALRTHLPLRGAQGADTRSRNHINVLTSDVIVALPGGAGTASEVRLALEYGRPVLAFLDRPDEIPDLSSEVPWTPSLEVVQDWVWTHIPDPQE